MVSVIVTTYNHKDYIKECLDSILSQVCNFPFEIIIGEDESQDGTRDICKQYALKHPEKIKLFLRSRKDVIYINGNPTGRFNFRESLKVAKGTYIALCEGDDYWADPLKLQKQVDILEKNKDYILCHHWQKYAIYQNEEWVEVAAPKKGHGYFPNTHGTVKEVFENKLRVKSRSLLFRNVITENFFPDWYTKVAFGDVALSFLLGKLGSFYFIDEPMAVYRQTNQGLSTAGKTTLGNRKFIVRHFKNWISIWDFGLQFYNYKFSKEALATVSLFYKRIIDHLPRNHISLLGIMRFNFFSRTLPFLMKVSSFKLFFKYYIRRIIKK
ncbi:glycosyltransferase [Patiriisocius hiemis]|uniref:Glycosyltransferase n=1 Tax=Patiriisocius hiemis TaxID=3075604 RepID=A0ABU2YE62_9FLAO|nr:glycosyltransferase [Constantimarinum sp. W242]MDT0556022.1 glycosyltransferase [Constantimarinum sp. W242]